MTCCICDSATISKHTLEFPPGHEMCPACYEWCGQPCQALHRIAIAALRASWPAIRHAMARDNAAQARTSMSGQMRRVV